MSLPKLFIIGCIGCLLAACGQKAAYRVELKLSNLKAQNLYAVFESADGKQVDTVAYQPEKGAVITRNEGVYDLLTIYFENHQEGITIGRSPSPAMHAIRSPCK